MFTLIISLVFVVAALIAMGIGALKAKKKVWQFSVTRMILSVVSAILAALAASLVSWFVLGFLVDSMLSSLFAELMAGLSAGKEIITALLSMIVAPILFLPFYAIIKSIAKIFTKMLTRLFCKITTKKPAAEAAEAGENAETEATAVAEADEHIELTDKELKKAKKLSKKNEFKLEKSNWISALCGAACGLITLCILLVPFTGFLGIVNDVAALPLETAAEKDESGTVAMVADILDGAANNAGSFTVKYTGGQLLYDMMTTYKVGEERATLRNETAFIKAVANAVIALGEDELEKEYKADAVRGISDAFEESTLMPTLITDITAAAADNWRNGETYAGMAMPSMGPFDPIMMSMVDAFAQGTVETIREDLDTIVEVIAVLIENDAMESFGEDPLIILSREETTAEVINELLQNPRLHVMVDGLSDFGISMLMTTIGVDDDCRDNYGSLKAELNTVVADDEYAYADIYAEVFDDYGLRVSEELCLSAGKVRMADGDMNKWLEENIAKDADAYAEAAEIVTVNDIIEGVPEITDNEKEAKALAHSFAVIYGLTDDMGGDSFEVKNMLANMGSVLDSFAATETYGAEKTPMILKAMLQSDLVHDEMGFSVLEATDAANSIAKNSATKGYVSMMNSLALVVEALEASSDLDTNNREAVEAMLNDLTPESAEVLSSVATPQVMLNYGATPAGAKPTSKLMGDTFKNLADAKEKGMPDAEYAKETAAVSNMMTVVMDSGKGAIFGKESATGITAKEFVGDIANSKVMSDTLVDTVYGDGNEPTNDPLKSERTMADSEKTEFIDALNAQWESSNKSIEDVKELTSIAAVMNVDVKVDPINGVVAK